MPLLYREGSMAFRRLQLELLKSSDDESIFAWERVTDVDGVLAPSPAYFGMSSTFARWDTDTPRHAYTVTNKGLEIHVPKYLARKKWFLLPLSCRHSSGKVYAIALKRDGAQWYRVMDFWPEDQKDVHKVGGGLFVVDSTQLWDRETLRASGSEVIHVSLDD